MSWTNFTQAEIERTIANRGLLSIELEVTDACDFNCVYCYRQASAGNTGNFENTGNSNPSAPSIPSVPSRGSLSDSELRDTVTQAKTLGARLVVLLGGDPLLRPGIGEFCVWLHEQGLAIDLFTSGSGLTPELAETFFQSNVRVVLKMNSADAQRQDRFANRPGAYAVIQSALANLRAAGYPTADARLAVSNVIFNGNSDETESLWRWTRREGIEPYFERFAPCGKDDPLQLPPAEVERIFNRLAEIDRTEFGLDWQPRPPLVANTCMRHQFSCTVTADGRVLPCVGVTCTVGDVRKTPLRQILRDSEMIESLRNYRQNIKGPCAQCDLSAECYGCRGTAFHLTGDALASDPLCWRNAGKDIPALPCDAAPYLPHQPPMRFVTRLLSVGEKTTEAEATLASDALCLLPDGTLDPVFYAELAAQAFAAGISFRHWRRNDGKPIEGLLLGMSNLRTLGTAHSGDTLRISLLATCEMDGFAILNAAITRNGEPLAEGALKVCNQPLPREEEE